MPLQTHRRATPSRAACRARRRLVGWLAVALAGVRRRPSPAPALADPRRPRRRPRPPRPPPRRAPKPPNLVFVLTDDLEPSLLKYMPTVRSMQKAGASFSDYTVSDSLCCPSRTSIFTGQYPHTSGVFTNSGADGGYGAFENHGLADQTYAVALQKAGYRTGVHGQVPERLRPQGRRRHARLERPEGLERVGRGRQRLPRVRLHDERERA